MFGIGEDVSILHQDHHGIVLLDFFFFVIYSDGFIMPVWSGKSIAIRQYINTVNMEYIYVYIYNYVFFIMSMLGDIASWENSKYSNNHWDKHSYKFVQYKI